MASILGIDAAWTASEPSGVALIQGQPGSWRCVLCAPSYDTFLAQAAGAAPDWNAPRIRGGPPPIKALLEAAGHCTTEPVAVIAADIPLANEPITERRAADDAISIAFGGRGCAAHSPSVDRPGPISAQIVELARDAGYPLATRVGAPAPCILEVYPHPAAMALLGRDYRVPYKVAKGGRYWPQATALQRRQKLLAELGALRDGLAERIGGVNIPVPTEARIVPTARLKRFEDAIDALICAWVGECFLEGRAQPYGDARSAVWCPVAR